MFGKPQENASAGAPRPNAGAAPRPGGPAPGQPPAGGPAAPNAAGTMPGGPTPQAGPRPGGPAPQPGAPRQAPARRPGAAPSRPAGERASLAGQADNGRLTVGQEIKMSGEIKSCDRLVVEGTVEANLSDSRALEVTETGIFRGTAEIDMAEINGVFEGDLNVEGRLFIRAQGRVSGTIRYGELEIERGGRISGEVGNQSEAVASSGYRRPYGEDEL